MFIIIIFIIVRKQIYLEIILPLCRSSLIRNAKRSGKDLGKLTWLFSSLWRSCSCTFSDAGWCGCTMRVWSVGAPVPVLNSGWMVLNTNLLLL